MSTKFWVGCLIGVIVGSMAGRLLWFWWRARRTRRKYMQMYGGKP